MNRDDIKELFSPAPARAVNESLGLLSRDEAAMRNTDGDRLAWMDAHRAYIEFGKTGDKGSSYINFDPSEGAWDVHVHNGAIYDRLEGDGFSTLRDAIQALIDL